MYIHITYICIVHILYIIIQCSKYIFKIFKNFTNSSMWITLMSLKLFQYNKSSLQNILKFYMSSINSIKQKNT